MGVMGKPKPFSPAGWILAGKSLGIGIMGASTGVGAMIGLIQNVRARAESGVPEALRLSRYNGGIARAAIGLSYGEMARNYKMAASLEKSSVNYLRAVNVMRNAWLEPDIAKGRLSNFVNTEMAGLSTIGADIARPWAMAVNAVLKNPPNKPATLGLWDATQDAISEGQIQVRAGLMLAQGYSLKDVAEFVSISREEYAKVKAAMRNPNPIDDIWQRGLTQQAKMAPFKKPVRVGP
jgi:hypothetical protein